MPVAGNVTGMTDGDKLLRIANGDRAASQAWTENVEADLLAELGATEVQIEHYKSWISPLVRKLSANDYALNQDQVDEVVAELREHIKNELENLPTDPAWYEDEEN